MKKTKNKIETFTFEQFCADFKENYGKFIQGRLITATNAPSLICQISENKESSTDVSMTADGQYLIRVSQDLLRGCYDLATQKVRPYFRKINKHEYLSEEAFIRLVCGCAAMLAFFHEFAHIARNVRHVIEINGCSINVERGTEVDADIHGSALLFVHFIAIHVAIPNDFPLSSLARGYVLGIRLLFEVLHQDKLSEDLLHEKSKHPHSYSRYMQCIAFGATHPDFEAVQPVLVPRFEVYIKRYFVQLEDMKVFPKIDIELFKSSFVNDSNVWAANKRKVDVNSTLKINKPGASLLFREKLRQAWHGFSRLFSQ